MDQVDVSADQLRERLFRAGPGEFAEQLLVGGLVHSPCSSRRPENRTGNKFAGPMRLDVEEGGGLQRGVGGSGFTPTLMLITPPSRFTTRTARASSAHMPVSTPRCAG